MDVHRNSIRKQVHTNPQNQLSKWNNWEPYSISCHNWVWLRKPVGRERQENLLESLHQETTNSKWAQYLGVWLQTSSQQSKLVKHLYCTNLNYIHDAQKNDISMWKENFWYLAPTKDVLQKHIMRANYQCLVWKQALSPRPRLPSPTSCGWVQDCGQLRPVLLTLPPIPKACEELVTCSCKTNCGSRCGCLWAGQKACLAACGCEGTCNIMVDD